jgi:hypothetical protein
VINRIETLLNQDDAAAESLLGDLESCLSGADWQDQLRKLRDLIEDIEYAAALALLERMRGALKGASS